MFFVLFFFFCRFDIVERQLGRSIVERLRVRPLGNVYTHSTRESDWAVWEKSRAKVDDRPKERKKERETEALGAALYLSMCTPE
jgi:hypothetical protein